MLEFHRDEFAAAIGPQVELLREIVDAAMATGRIRTDLSATDVTGLLTVTLMSAAQMSLLDVELTSRRCSPDQLWAWCAAAVGADQPGRLQALRGRPRSTLRRRARPRPDRSRRPPPAGPARPADHASGRRVPPPPDP
jgi:hypothetical protein